MPFKSALSFLGDLALDLGGTVGTLGTDEKATLFTSEAKPKTATMICYESVDGEYVAEFVRKGAEILFIITNDGWWKDSPGHRQHAAFARLRAIETRRPIARSANTGISCFVSPKGEQTQQTAYWEEAVIKQELIPQNKITFYVTYGNYIYRAASFLAVLFLLLSIVSSHLRKKEIGNLIKTQNNV
jgi:apolipoprotein N-acyltransferase